MSGPLTPVADGLLPHGPQFNAKSHFFLPFVMFYSDRQYPLPVGLQYLLESTAAFNPSLGGGVNPVLRLELAMATLVAIAPVFIVFLFA